jgi:hypothetical protein
VKSRVLVLALSFYVTLDLSLAAMPGAFVFEPDETVESTLSLGPRRPAPGGSARPTYFALTCLPRAPCALPQDSEDPY